MGESTAATGSRKRPRLLLLTPDFPPSVGGIQLLLGRLAEELQRSWDVLVVARGADGPWCPPARRTRLRSGVPALAEVNARGVAEGLRHRPDVVLNGHVVTFPAAAVVGRAAGCPVVTYTYADEVPARPWLARAALRGSSRTIAISRFTRDLVCEFGATEDEVPLVLPGVDQLEDDPQSDPEPGLVVTVARLADRYKGHALVLEAMAILRREVDARWVVVGDGPLRPELESRARELDLLRDGTVTFAGRVTDAERDAWLRRADVFVMPSRLPPAGGGEGFGIVYLEAGLRGVPAVAGRAGGVPDAVLDGETGLLVDPTDPRAIADALRRVITDRGLRDRLGERAAERARALTWSEMATRVEAVLQDALAR